MINTRTRNFQKIQFDRLFKSKHLSFNPLTKPTLGSASVFAKDSLGQSDEFVESRLSILLQTLFMSKYSSPFSTKFDRSNVGISTSVIKRQSGFGQSRFYFPGGSVWVLQTSDRFTLVQSAYVEPLWLKPFQRLIWREGLDFYMHSKSCLLRYEFKKTSGIAGNPKVQEIFLRFFGTSVRVTCPKYVL